MFRKLIGLTGLAALGLAVMSVTAARADTITLHDLSENTATGVFTYAITLDAAANVQGGDGFVIYDFPGFTSYSITGGLTTTQFNEVTTLTSNVLTSSSAVDANGHVAAVSNSLPFDSSSIPNLNFVYAGPPATFLGATTATLTINTSLRGGLAASVYASVDHSGPGGGIPFSFSSNPVLVPATTVPAPSGALAAAGLMGLLALNGKKLARVIA
jgi:hypothetical protein